MFRITYTEGNGYRCGCCRETRAEYIEFNTDKDLIEWLIEFEFTRKNPRNGYDDGDKCIDDIIEIKNYITEEFLSHPEFIKGMKEKQNEVDEKAEKKRKAEEKAKKTKKINKEKKERERLKELAEKYPEELR